MKAVVYTLGCKINQYESRGLMNKLVNSGFSVSEELETADIYVLNTCAITKEAERKSRQVISKFLRLNPNAPILALGCAVQNDWRQFKKPNIIQIGGTASKIDSLEAFIAEARLACKGVSMSPDYIPPIEAENARRFRLNACAEVSMPFNETKSKEGANAPVDLSLPTEYEDCYVPFSSKTRELIKVQDGCNNFCSYCIVPYLRGRSRSRSIDSIEKEIQKSKAREIVLSGINLSAYGQDIGSSLAKLIEQIASERYRIRLGSLEVNIIDKRLLEAMKNANCCPHFHLSLQSGSNEVLRAMNRKYTIEEYEKKVELIRSVFKNPNITTDIIAGFPLETIEAHEQTMSFMQRIGFGDCHIFPYSPRDGTNAAKLPSIEKNEVLRRAKELSKLRDYLRDSYHNSCIGELYKLLPETHESENGIVFTRGYTENYLEIRVQGAYPLNEFFETRLH